MADEPDNLTLRILRQVDAKLDTLMERFFEMTARMGSLEHQLSGIRTDISGLRSDFVRLEHRMDNSPSACFASNAGSI
jgi:archaellum component FlaC